MYERPAVPTENFIDDAINANYMGSNNMWEQQMGGNQFPMMQGMQVPMMPPMNTFQQLNQQQVLATKPAAAKPAAKAEPASPKAEAEPAAAPKAEEKVEVAPKVEEKVEKETEVAKEEPAKKTASEVDAEEEAAVARFRDAYHAMKYADHPEQGKVEESQKTAGMFDSLFDESDKKAMGLFMGDRKELPEDAFGKSDFGMDGVLDKIVDEALGEIAPKEEEHKHKHHHSKKSESSGGVELVTEPTVVDAKPEPPAVEAKPEKKDDMTFSDEEKAALKKLVQKLSKSDDKTKADLEKEIGADDAKTIEALAPKEQEQETLKVAPEKPKNGLKKVSDKKEALVASDVNKADKAVNLAQKTLFEEEEEQAGLPAVPPKPSTDAKSFIQKAPKVSDYIPEPCTPSSRCPLTRSPRPCLSTCPSAS